MSLLNKSIVPLSKLQQVNKLIPEEIILEMLNVAVWAPNHKLREPWRFVYVDHEISNKLECFQKEPSAHLILVNKCSSDSYQQTEDAAATFCLVQNFRLIAWEYGVGVNVIYPKWRFDRRIREKLGILNKEYIVVVLELGYVEEHTIINTIETQQSFNRELNWSYLQ
ncbi:nitroreductase family protein [Bacillus altitudinis]|uniref:nitroreductase family protein n=1 Tax=Bacillus altitudinis TaxID=293387 RepID=UPI0006934469|nr:nitroreductase family protein [Bacillus altitudinis]